MFTYLINFVVSSIIKIVYWKQHLYLSLFSFVNLMEVRKLCDLINSTNLSSHLANVFVVNTYNLSS